MRWKSTAATWLTVAILALVGVNCGGDSAPPGPSPVSSLIIGQPTPGSGSTIITTGIIPRGSGQLSVPITITSGREVPWAQLNVYLLTTTALGYCGQNLPDAPTWGPFAKGQTVSVTITGFQVGACEVTGLRAMLHTRNSGSLTPPTSSETVVEGTLAVAYTIRSGPTPTLNLSGSWRGTWQSVRSAGGSMTAALTQAGNSLNGSASVTGSSCFSNGAVTGTVASDAVTIGVAFGGSQQVNFSGVAAADGRTMGGQYSVTGGSCSGDAGAWTLTRS